jgi:NADH dehydrogenase (ubiquinone) 1 alpha subcomplex subunit 2
VSYDLCSAIALHIATELGKQFSLILTVVIRSFIVNNYEGFKASSPEMPFIVRECTNAQPTVMARYDFGVERRLYLNNASEVEVSEAVNELVDQADKINSAAA